MMWIAAVVVLRLLGCPPPSQYRVERPGLTCERATRVAYRTMVALGYTITTLVPADPVHPGDIVGTRPGPEGEGTETARVVIRCGGQGATLQPVEDALFPAYDFSRAFGYSFKTLVQQPDVEEPRAAVGLEVLVKSLSAQEAVLDLDGVPTGPAAVTVRVTVRNHTDRAVALDPTRVDLVPDDGAAVGPLSGAAFDGALVAGAAGERVRRERLTSGRIPPRTTRAGCLVYPAGRYREARIAIEDVETGETEGFVAPVQ